MKNAASILKNITLFTQFGLSLITPLLLCLAICWVLVSYAGLGVWIYVPGFVLGLGGSGTFAYNFYLSVIKKEEKDKNEEKKEKVFFNEHI
ncbi:MAG: AtpZ/AtpI family protein [Lachnospiraceae bacterium]|nr:AtpZ/AtpI family protein [Lachnospiraceae bacterium]